MNPIHDFQGRVWSRIRAIATAPTSPRLLSGTESEHFVRVVRYIFDLRHGQNAARVAATYLGYRLANPTAEVTPALIELAAALEIANTSITYIEDKLIDEDRENQRGQEWTHIFHGPPLATVVNSFVHFLSRKTFYAALQTQGGTKQDYTAGHWLLEEFESIFRDANYGQFLDIIYGSKLFPTSTGSSFRSEEDPCEEVLSDHINDLRTGQFVRRSAEFGCVFGGVRPDSDQLRRLRTAMRLVGICVQDLNDLQDFVPMDDFPGSCGKDLALLKKTLPVIRLIEGFRSIPEARQLIDEIRRQPANQAAMFQVRDLLAREGIFSELANRIVQRLNVAHDVLAVAFAGADSTLAVYFDDIRLKTTTISSQLESVHI
jgi:geranylgeranyl pyrophosphate synthase